MMERVIIDMDEVIADTMGAMISYYEQTFGLMFDAGQIREGSWMKGFAAEHRDHLRDKLMGPGFFRDLPVMEDAVDVLAEMNKQYEIFIVSAAVEFPNSLKDKHDWLLEHFPFFTWRQLVLCGDKRMIHGDHMIDDHPRNLIHFPGRKHLFDSLHNRHIEEYERMMNWKHAAEIFLK